MLQPQPTPRPRFAWQLLVKQLNRRNSFSDKDSPIEQGHKEAIKEQVKNLDQNQAKLEALITRAEKTLFGASSVFPFELFPNTIVIDTHKINIIFYEFFFSKRYHSIQIKDISDVIVDTGPFFATIKIFDMGFKENIIELPYFWKKDALKIRRIIQGLAVAHKHEIDLTKVEIDELGKKIEELGEVEELRDKDV